MAAFSNEAFDVDAFDVDAFDLGTPIVVPIAPDFIVGTGGFILAHDGQYYSTGGEEE